ncbi:MAG: polyprenol monophosphomannose synthase [Chloroflexi bacterium]|nr:polyprenol monophosphomannose synthase [Chloroflexota bacterium]
MLPALNEARNLPPLIAAIDSMRVETSHPLHVLIIDDGSTDETAEVAASLKQAHSWIHFVRHERNKGLGSAIRTGLAFARARDYRFAFVMDADLSQDPRDLPALRHALEQHADLAIGSRYVRGGEMEGVPIWRQIISSSGNTVARLVLGIKVRDMTSGFRGFRVSTAGSLPFTETGYGIQLETVVKAAAAGLIIKEVPITLRLRKYGSSKLLYNFAFWRRYIKLFLRAWAWMHRKDLT